jgi:rare lipoprotein A
LSSQVTPAKGVKVATAGNTDRLLSSSSSAGASTNNLQDPVWRATAVAAKLNQLDRERFDAKAVKVIWDVRRKSYVISANNEHLLEMSPQTILPHTTHDPAKDALQITNRLRQQLGNAPPLTQIPGQPVAKKTRTPQILAFGPIRFQIKGWASWYGPGFQGNPTASGERFNQYALTAAHRTLPFGTRMRVTNLYNGRSVVVRVNDRGPYSGGRVLDLSRGAAQVLGVVNSGTAPVKIDVLH